MDGIKVGDRVTWQERFWAMVTKSEHCWEWTGSGTRNGYGQFHTPAGRFYAHRIAYEMDHGPIGAGLQLDHLCHSRRCVRPDHLRTVTNKQNHENRSPNPMRGVTFNKQRGLWKAQAMHLGKRYHGGYFDTIDEAAEAARQLRLSLFTHNDRDRKTA